MTDGEASYVCFLYETVNWGPGAQIGFNAGDGIRSYTVPAALTAETINFDQLSNIDRPGVFVFRVDGEGSIITNFITLRILCIMNYQVPRVRVNIIILCSYMCT